ncbi:hypothetical protein SNEBB_009935, partial [Seison nebaliae]
MFVDICLISFINNSKQPALRHNGRFRTLTDPLYSQIPSPLLLRIITSTKSHILQTINIWKYKNNLRSGDNGTGVEKPMISSFFKFFNFRQDISHIIPLDRTLPEIREKECMLKNYGILHRKVSIIITYHDEPHSTLFRSLTSIANRTPHELIHEIIIINDGSVNGCLDDCLFGFVGTYGLSKKTKVYSTSNQLGFTMVRMEGVKRSTGDIIVFLESHIECMDGWLEPLIYEINKNNHTVAAPTLDTINANTFKYEKATKFTYGAFDWKLNFMWRLFTNRSSISKYEPFEMPVMPGGLYAITKDYFLHLGGYDTKFELWGSENLEISFRIWRCGGRIVEVPCSRIGHIFREFVPYILGKQIHIVNQNRYRLIKLWLGDYEKFFTLINPELSKFKKIDIDEQLELHRKLNCKSLRWYLQNIFGESFLPITGRKFGVLKNFEKNLCLRIKGKDLKMEKCLSNESEQYVMLNKQKQLFMIQYCLLFNEGELIADHCFENSREWKILSSNRIYNEKLENCVAYDIEKKKFSSEICHYNPYEI